MGPTVWVLFFVCFFLQSKPNADNDKHEGGKKTKQNKRRNEGLQDNKTTFNARQDNTKQKAKAKHRLALNISNGITSSK